MRAYSICRNCAEVHPAELECPACAGPMVRAPARPIIRSRRVDDDAGAHHPVAPPPAQVRRGVVRASTVVVSAYVFAVVVLLLAVFAQA
jgi:hypothetical protein